MKPYLKIIIVIGLILVAILIIYFGWQRITRLPANDLGSPPDPNISPASSSSNPKIKKISDQKVFDFWIVPTTAEVYYLTPEGKILSAKDGTDPEISSQTVVALNKIETSPTNQKILAAFDDPKNPSWGIFDIIDKVWRPLPNEIINATWGANDNQLIAILKNSSDLNLATVDLIKSPPPYKTIIKDFRTKDVILKWLPPNQLIVRERPAASYAGRLWRLDLKTLDFNLIFAQENGQITKWSSDNNALAFKFSLPNRFLIFGGGTLEEGGAIAPFITLPSKCTGRSASTSTASVYCFVPQEIPNRTILPDDYLKKSFFSIDDLILAKIDLRGKKILDITNPLKNGSLGAAFDAENPKTINNLLYFINRYDRALYQIELEK